MKHIWSYKTRGFPIQCLKCGEVRRRKPSTECDESLDKTFRTGKIAMEAPHA